nr:uncharacterized protein CTRU02_12555 [Colletotrichum truncatum]KAF6784566.1 hypothetical protein CTRU02_12555 [Colletotrichum truncatum]
MQPVASLAIIIPPLCTQVWLYRPKWEALNITRAPLQSAVAVRYAATTALSLGGVSVCLFLVKSSNNEPWPGISATCFLDCVACCKLYLSI